MCAPIGELGHRSAPRKVMSQHDRTLPKCPSAKLTGACSRRRHARLQRDSSSTFPDNPTPAPQPGPGEHSSHYGVCRCIRCSTVSRYTPTAAHALSESRGRQHINMVTRTYKG